MKIIFEIPDEYEEALTDLAEEYNFAGISEFVAAETMFTVRNSLKELGYDSTFTKVNLSVKEHMKVDRYMHAFDLLIDDLKD